MAENKPQRPPAPPMPPPAGHRPPPGMKAPPPPPPGVKRPPAPVPPTVKIPAPPPPVASYAPPEVPTPVETKNTPEKEPEDRFDIEDDEDEDIDEDVGGLYDDNMAAALGLPPVFIKTKVLIPLFCLMIFIGAAVGVFFERSTKTASEELPGVVSNPEIPKGRPRCGLARKGQGCVFYIMNPSNREMMAKDFFDVASSLLKMPKFQIETANIQYATTRIPPGYIALFNVPPVQ